MKTEEPEMMLPEGIRNKAVMSGREWGWRRGDIQAAIAAAKDVGLVNVGGQVQFVLPDGPTCELYWKCYDSSDRRSGEPWADYVFRSAQEVLQALQKVLESDLVADGVTNFRVLAERQAGGESLEKHLLFIAYFNREGDGEPPAGGD